MDFIDAFIEEYRNNPCLWKADSADFKNRTKRQEAYLKLIDVAAKHGEHYNVERTKQKINNLRCAFRHQLKKYTEYQSKGLTDEPYCPKRKYFESLMFLRDEEKLDKKSKISPSSASIDNIEICTTYETSSVEPVTNITTRAANKKDTPLSVNYVALTDKLEYSNSKEDFNNGVAAAGEANSTDIQVVYDYENEVVAADKTLQMNTSRKRSCSVSSQVSTNDAEIGGTQKVIKTPLPTIDIEKLLALACKNCVESIDDNYAHFGKIVAHKLRNMEASQAIFAEKLIGDVLYQGQMKLLTSLSVQRLLANDISDT